jgi:Protein of unknown function (DUF3050)
VLAEESDINYVGQPQSHFAMYLEAMQDMGVNIDEINNFVKVYSASYDGLNELKRHVRITLACASLALS